MNEMNRIEGSRPKPSDGLRVWVVWRAGWGLGEMQGSGVKSDMNGYLTDFWRDTIDVVELLLALVPMILAGVGRLVSGNASPTKSPYQNPGKVGWNLGSGARCPGSVRGSKFSLFEYSPQRRAKQWLTSEQALSVKIFTGAAIATILGSYYLPTLDTSAPGEAILKWFLVILSFGGALLQVGIALSLVFEALVHRYPKSELWFSDTVAGNGLASLLCLPLLLVSFRIFDSVIGGPPSWSSYLILDYTFSCYFYAFARLLIGVGLAVEHTAAVIRRRPRT